MNNKYTSGDEMKKESLFLVKAIAIDYYGTLVDVGHPFLEIRKWFTSTYNDSTNDINGIYISFMKEHARLLFDKEFYLGQVLLMNSYKKTCDKYNIKFMPAEFNRLIINLFTESPAFLGAQRAIENLRKHYPVLLLTNADNQILYKSIEKQGFKFDYIVSSEDMRCNKPDIKLFQRACELLHTPAEHVVMIGDSLTDDVQGAMSYGMQSIWINTNDSMDKESVLQLSSVCDIESILCKTR